jgi:hypothetical protein
MGKHKVPTLRNVGKRPGSGFPKAYMHNGALKSLAEVVHFYNTRDVESWPAPEVAENVNTDELGDLGLTSEEELALVAFLETLSDGFVPGKSGSTQVATRTRRRMRLSVAGPNPFNPVTRLQMNLPRGENVTVEVFNLAGQRVAGLVDGWMEAGEHSVQFAADNLPSGIYVVRMNVGAEVLSTKITLLK